MTNPVEYPTYVQATEGELRDLIHEVALHLSECHTRNENGAWRCWIPTGLKRRIQQAAIADVYAHAIATYTAEVIQ